MIEMETPAQPTADDALQGIARLEREDHLAIRARTAVALLICPLLAAGVLVPVTMLHTTASLAPTMMHAWVALGMALSVLLVAADVTLSSFIRRRQRRTLAALRHLGRTDARSTFDRMRRVARGL